jgi:hypothetical protein
MRWTACLLPLALAACGSVTDGQPAPDPAESVHASDERSLQPSSDPDPAAPEGSQPITAVGDLLGEYRVAGIDGTEVAGDVGLAVSIDGAMLSYEPTCAGFVWTIAEARGGFVFTRAPGYGPTRQPDGSIAVCAVGIAPEQRRLGEAVDAARHAWRTPANGILLEGGGRSILLFSQ